jgi:hypothetical protein
LQDLSVVVVPHADRQARIQHVQGIHTTLWIIVSEYPPELAGDFDRLDASLFPSTRFIARVTN